MAARQISGDPSITTYETAKEIVDTDIQRALTGVGVTQMGAERQSTLLPKKNFGEQQANAYMKSLGEAMRVRFKTFEDRFKSKMGKEAPEGIFQSEDSRNILDSILMKDTSGREAGATLQPKTQTEYDAMPSGSLYVDGDGQTKRKK